VRALALRFEARSQFTGGFGVAVDVPVAVTVGVRRCGRGPSSVLVAEAAHLGGCLCRCGRLPVALTSACDEVAVGSRVAVTKPSRSECGVAVAA